MEGIKDPKRLRVRSRVLAGVALVAVVAVMAVGTAGCIRVKVVGSAKSDVYHVIGCQYVVRIGKDNMIVFKDWQEAQDAGYRLCTVCLGN